METVSNDLMGTNSNDILSPYFTFLVKDLGFRVISETVADIFDNMVVILKSDDLYLEIIRDRGDFLVKIGQSLDANGSAPLTIVRALVLRIDSVVDATIADQAEFLKTHYAAVKDLFSDQNVRTSMQRLTNLQQERFTRTFPEWACANEIRMTHEDAQNAAVRDLANRAWECKNWEIARKLYEEARHALSAKELRRLNFLEKKNMT